MQLLWIILCSALRNLQTAHLQTWHFYPNIYPFQNVFCLRSSKLFADFVELSLSRYKTCENVMENRDIAGRSWMFPPWFPCPFSCQQKQGMEILLGWGNSDSKRVLFHRTIFQGDFYFHLVLNRVQSQVTSAEFNWVPSNGILGFSTFCSCWLCMRVGKQRAELVVVLPVRCLREN